MYPTLLIDFITGKQVQKLYDKYTETQWYSESDIRAYQLDKLKSLIQHCYVNVPYYSKIMRQLGMIPSDINSLKDINVFPILDKPKIKENYSDFFPLNAKKFKGIKHGQTGGTTGNSLLKRNDAITRSSVWASYRRFCNWMDVGYDDWNVLIKGVHVLPPSYKDRVKQSIYEYLRKTVTIDAYRGNLANLQQLGEEIRKHDYRLVRGYSQAIYEVARLANERGLKFAVKAVSTTAEPLLPEYRPVIRDAFGCEVYDQYGCGEIGGIAYECDKHQGLHVTEERVLVETNDKNEVLLTDLDNFVMPFIRYWNGDEVEIASQKCTCGRNSKVIKKIRGRTSDYLFGINGAKVHWGYIFHLLWDTRMALQRNFVKFQLVQISPYELVFRHVSDPLTTEDMDIIIKTTHSKLGDMKLTFVKESDIECSASGKYRWVENRLITK